MLTSLLHWPIVGALVASALLAAPESPARGQVRTEWGELEYEVSSNGALVAAPHGTYDANTAAIAVAAARRLGTGYLIFTGTAPGLRINVNRPTEGAGRACASEPLTARARTVYDLYLRVARTAADTPRLALYVEVHGNGERAASQRIDVASKGISRAEARSVKAGYPAALAGIRQEWPDFPELALFVEPADRVLFGASCTKTLGILSTDLAPRALHFELPRRARAPNAIEPAASLVARLVDPLLRSP